MLERTAISLAAITQTLAQTQARDVVAFIDACFSGAGGRSVLPEGARPLVLVKTVPAAPSMSMFTASTGAQISGPDAGGTHGAYTKFVLEGLGTGAADINGDHQISLQELSEWVSPRVAAESELAGRQQTPTLVLGSSYGSAREVILAYGLATR
jgi:hypothetical protein